MAKDYDVNAMKDYSKKYSDEVENVLDAVKRMTATIQNASEENTAKAVMTLCQTFSDKVMAFMEVPKQMVTLTHDTTRSTEAYDAANGGGN